jgi:hypothetical protein
MMMAHRHSPEVPLGPSCSVCTNRATRILASTLGVLVGIGSIEHGLLECLQGFHPTPGMIVNALGPNYRWTVWKQGGEGAFTLIPNFLLSGIVSTLLGVLMIAWSLRFIESRRGPLVFLLLGVASFLTGGGVAQVVLFTLTWGVATRIHASLAFWHRLIPRQTLAAVGPLWPWTLAASTVLFLVALEIAVFGFVPGVSDQTELLHVCWMTLAVALALYLISVGLGLAKDASVRCTSVPARVTK